MIKMSMVDRAKQFGSFSALRGYEDLIEGKKIIHSPKKEITEERAIILSEKIKEVKKGSIVKITYYLKEGYITKEGVVSKIDFTMKNLTLIKDFIDFNDIWDINIVGNL